MANHTYIHLLLNFLHLMVSSLVLYFPLILKIPHEVIVLWTEVAGKVTKGCLNQSNEETHDANTNEIHVLSDELVERRIQETDVKKDRDYQIMQGFSKALWTVLKQYKEKLEVVLIPMEIVGLSFVCFITVHPLNRYTYFTDLT